MKIDLTSMYQHWREASSMEINGSAVTCWEFKCREGLMIIRRTMVEVAKTSDDLFRTPDRLRKGRNAVVATRLGRRVETCLNLGIDEIISAFPQHRFDPYFSLFVDTWRASSISRRSGYPRQVNELNQVVSKLRNGAKEREFMTRLANHERGAMKNAKAVQRYVDLLYGDYAKILHVRMDVYYDNKQLSGGTEDLPAERLKSDRAKLMRYIRKKFKRNFIGHMWTIEYGAMKGPHFHLYLHFRGDRLREGITIARHLGEQWQHVITGGLGRYWNVNVYQDRLEAQGRRGIGLISHSDEKRRHNLLQAALYLTNVDLFVRVEIPGLTKTFGHGRVVRRKKSKSGRKRRISALHSTLDTICELRGGFRRPNE
jgi:hypothetical protein